MCGYDAILKRGLMRFSRAASALVTGFEPRRWLNVALPDVRTPRVDLLGETEDGRLFHIELQSGNDPDMALRMLDYSLQSTVSTGAGRNNSSATPARPHPLCRSRLVTPASLRAFPGISLMTL